MTKISLTLIFKDPINNIKLTHWGRVTHICGRKIIIIGSLNGLSSGRRQAIIWNNAGTLLIGLLRINLSDFFYRNQYIFIEENMFKNVVCETCPISSRPQCVIAMEPKRSQAIIPSVDCLAIGAHMRQWAPIGWILMVDVVYVMRYLICRAFNLMFCKHLKGISWNPVN